MNLCIVTHSVVKGDGQGRVNYEVAQEALRRGYTVTLLASRVAPELEQHPRVQWVRLSVDRVPTEFVRNLVFAHQSAQWLRQHRSQFDVVKVNGAITWVPGDLNAAHFVHSAWLRSPVHTIRQRRDAYGVYQWLYTALNAIWEKRAFRQAKTVVAVSNQVAQDLIRIGIPPAQIQVILNGVDVQEFQPGVGNRARWGLPDDVPLAIFAGDIRTPRKNLDTILRALAQVPALHLAVVGGTDGSPYPALADELGIRDRTHFLGYQREVAKIMQAADFLVFPSRYETFGLVVLEAMSTGIPVITAVTTPAAELVTPECGIVLTDPDQVSTLVQALNTLTQDSTLRQQMGQVARTIAEQHRWTGVAQRYVDLCEELAHAHHCRHSDVSPSAGSLAVSGSAETADSTRR